MKNKLFFLGGLFILVFVCIFAFLFDKDIFTNKKIQYNGNNLMISIDGNTSTTLPTNGNYYLANYDCKNSNTKLTWNNETYTLDVSNGDKRGGVSCYLNFETYPSLSDMPVGSYVTYVGDNGCPDGHCDGTNANYVSDIDMGYCNNSNYRFTVNGWRIGYVRDGSAYLISAGAPECMCTNSDGTVSDSSCSDKEATAGTPIHLQNLDDKALTYCNKSYAYGGSCDSSTAWAMDATDFKYITGNILSSSSCYGTSQYGIASCGYNNDLIDGGGYYWYATSLNSSSSLYVIIWSSYYRSVRSNYSSDVNGVRPVIRLDSNVLVTGGSGTYEDPYTIGNNTFVINDGATEVSDADKDSVTLSLTSVNAAQVCVSTNTSVCTKYVDFSSNYTLDWSNEDAGEKVVYVYYKDVTGRIVASMNRSVTLSAS